MPEPKLPPDGTRVTAICLPSDEYDREAHEVTGILRTVPCPLDGSTNCWVDYLPVDPATVRVADGD